MGHRPGAGQQGGQRAGVIVGAGCLRFAVVMRADQDQWAGGVGRSGQQILKGALESGLVSIRFELLVQPISHESVILRLLLEMTRNPNRLYDLPQPASGDVGRGHDAGVDWKWSSAF